MLLRDSKKFVTLIVNQTIQLELIKLSQKLWNIGTQSNQNYDCMIVHVLLRMYYIFYIYHLFC